MTPAACAQERELIEQLVQGRPLEDWDSALQQHVARCDMCREVASVASAVWADGRDGLSEHHLPTASQVWWRAQVRARFDAAQTAGRPITFAQGAAGAAIVGMAASVVGWQWIALPARVVRELAVRATDADTTGLLSTVAPSPLGWAVLAACACVLVLMPLAALLALSDK
jgi:hypothetical protein